MKYYLFLFLLGCSSESIGQTSEKWADTCQSIVQSDLTTCITTIHWSCKDGSGGVFEQPALLSNLLGTTCEYNGKNYTYICSMNEWNEAMIVCGN